MIRAVAWGLVEDSPEVLDEVRKEIIGTGIRLKETFKTGGYYLIILPDGAIQFGHGTLQEVCKAAHDFLTRDVLPMPTRR